VARDERTPQAAPANHPRAEQESDELVVIVAAFFVDVIVLVLIGSLLAEVSRDERAAQATPTTHPGAEQEAREMTIVVFAFILDVVAFILLAPFADQVSDKQAPQAPAAGRAADQDAGETAILAAAFLGTLFESVALILIVAPVAKQPGGQQAAQSLASHHPASGQDSDEVRVPAVAVMGRCIGHRSSFQVAGFAPLNSATGPAAAPD
jgi:heme/copper-type cytochrome/quinol oxidase subunit 2